MKNLIHTIHEMKTFLLLWSTQSFSGLGSAMTSYALVIWSYSQKGSALMTALLMVSSYAPYVLLSIFAGALSDRWNKKRTMLVCDSIAALTTVVMLLLLKNGALQIWHLYVINGINGLMNTVQQPASEVATTRVLPEKYYQRVGGLKYFSSSLNSVMTPIIATAVMGMAGMGAVVAFDLFTFFTAFLVLAFGIRIPEHTGADEAQEKLLVSLIHLAGLLLTQSVYHLILIEQKGLTYIVGRHSGIVHSRELRAIVLIHKKTGSGSIVEPYRSRLEVKINSETLRFDTGRASVIHALGLQIDHLRSLDYRKTLLHSRRSRRNLHHPHHARRIEAYVHVHTLHLCFHAIVGRYV